MRLVVKLDFYTNFLTIFKTASKHLVALLCTPGQTCTEPENKSNGLVLELVQIQHGSDNQKQADCIFICAVMLNAET